MELAALQRARRAQAKDGLRQNAARQRVTFSRLHPVATITRHNPGNTQAMQTAAMTFGSTPGSGYFSFQALTAFGISLILHAVVALLFGSLSIQSPQLSAFEPIEVTFAATANRPQKTSDSVPALQKPVTGTSAKTEATETTSAPSPPADTSEGPEEPLVEARYEVTSLNNPKPPYPLAARRRGYHGRVLLAVHVRADGSCGGVKLKYSSGHRLLDSAALDTVRHWRFLPARRGDNAIDSWVEIPITFRLET